MTNLELAYSQNGDRFLRKPEGDPALPAVVINKYSPRMAYQLVHDEHGNAYEWLYSVLIDNYEREEPIKPVRR